MDRDRQRGRVLGVLMMSLLVLTLAACGGTKSQPPPTDPGTPAPTASLKASASQITAGQSATLTWTTAHATSVTITPSVSATALPVSGSAKVTPASTTTYKLTATGAGGTVTASVTVTVTVANTPPTVTLAASPAAIPSGGTATLTWTSTNATSVSIDPGVSATALALSGSATVAPTSTTTYTITATGPGGTATATATVAVGPTVNLNLACSSLCGANSVTIFTGGTATLTWTTTNATSVTIVPAVGTDPLPVNGSVTVTPTANTTYTITAADGQQKATATATVTVLPPGAAQSPIHHLIVVILQNHSFDTLFGKFPNANGLNPSVPGYNQQDANGMTVSPTLLPNLDNANLKHSLATYHTTYDNGLMDKFAATNGDLSMQYADDTVFGTADDGKSYGVKTLWDYASQYVLADNFFASALNTEPAQMLYMMAATVHDDLTSVGLPKLDKCSAVEQSKNGGAGNIAAPLAEKNIGDQMNAQKVTWAWYQGNFSNSIDGNCQNYVPQENPFQYFTSTAYAPNLQDFSQPDFQKTLTDTALPSVAFITPGPAYGMHPGSGDAANGIEWLDNLVQAVQQSPVWPDTAILVLWDESGGWYDHVPPPQLTGTQGLGMRVPVILISPFAKMGVISHQQMDFVSITRFIQWNWGLGMFNDPAHPEQPAREQQSGDICDLLTIPCAGPAVPSSP